MKSTTILVVICVIFVCAACTDKEPATTKPNTEYHFTEVDNSAERNFPTYRISESDNPTDNDIQREAQAVAKLNELDPISFKAKNSKLNAPERLAAIADYKSFLTKHQGDSVLIRHFRDRYARLLLEDRGLIQQSDSEQLLFLTNELITAKTGRFSTILHGLSKLKKRTDPAIFAKLVSETARQVDVSLKLHHIAQQRLPAMLEKLRSGELKSKGTLRKEFTVALIEKDDFQESIKLLESHKASLDAL